jgi:lysophospholipase L1-like esterase
MITIRQFVRLTTGGGRLRLKISNAFGDAPLTIEAVQVARATGSARSAINPKSSQIVRFGGRPSVTIPAGAEYWSDPVTIPMQALETVGVSMRVHGLGHLTTGHIASHATSYIATGDHVSDPALRDARPVEHWFALSSVAVDSPRGAGAIVALGDSITDGSHSTTDGNDRWPDRLAERLHADPHKRAVGILNLGIGGNRVLLDGVGPNALARFDRDVLAQPNVRTLIVLEGVNDLGSLTRDGPVTPTMHDELVERLTQAYAQIINRAHQHGLRVIGATILPFAGAISYRPNEQNEADRQSVNRWIRKAGHFDDVIDFDRALRDPSAPDHLRPEFDCGDHLHPSVAGYQAMGDAIPLELF